MATLAPLNPQQLVSLVERAYRATRRRVAADHSTIAQGQVLFEARSMVRYYLYARVAPSRRTHRRWDDEQVDRAQRFARSFAIAGWTAAPESADATATVFRLIGPDDMSERALYVRPSGLVELLWALRCSEDRDVRELDGLEIARVAAAIAIAISGEDYERLCRSSRWRPRVRKVDWLLGVSTAIPTSEGQREWTGLRFPGAPPLRARDSRASMPLHGYGRKALRSARRSRAPREVPTVLLRELRAANGYYGAGELDEQLAAEGLKDAQSVGP